MGPTVIVLLAVALTIAGLTLAAILWSVTKPDRRVWPPETFGPMNLFIGWIGTFAFFAAVAALGILDWGSAATPSWLRYGLGPILNLGGNAIVWSAVIGFGARQTMGAEGQLKTDSLYRYSRNPQYVADIAILVGWAMFSASVVALPAIIAGILVFVILPFAEEGWLESRYGNAYLRYRAAVRRFF